MINMRITTKRVANNYKHKKCKMKITKIKIMTTKKVVNTYSEKREKEYDDQHEDHNQKGCK